MTRKKPAILALILTLGIATALALVWSSRQPLGSREPSAPSQIIFISLDTLRADMLNAYGYTEFRTSPFLDSFADENILFENCIAQEPRTLTSHMSLFTGLMPQHHRVQDDAPLSEGIPTLPSVLQELGYRTQAFVDGGYLNRRWGFDRGFDDYHDSGGEGLETIVPEAMEWLKKNNDSDFFLFVHTYDIHSKGMDPYYSSPPSHRGMFSKNIDSDLRSEDAEGFSARWARVSGDPSQSDKDYIRATYAEGIRYVDEQLGEFFGFLKAWGFYDRALIVVWSDHGEGLLQHQSWGHGELFDHTIRVPLMMRIPGIDRAGARIRSLVSSQDLAPTILDLVNRPEAIASDGKSIMGYLDRDDGEGLAYSLRTKRGARRFSVRSLKHHAYWDENSGERYFFDLDTDPGEMNNLYPSSSAAARSLEREMLAWIERYDSAWMSETTSVPLEPDVEAIEQLRALGYVQ